ncbi:hypothetical protein, partial [Nostoc sp.]|uniref:hypothetical protein n=1 Tax=Nostoc sp. TaxID=1180 RepID=UPI002FFA7D99
WIHPPQNSVHPPRNWIHPPQNSVHPPRNWIHLAQRLKIPTPNLCKQKVVLAILSTQTGY